MKVEVVKAEKELGVTFLSKLKMDKEFEEYKKPGFYEKRTIRVVQEIPEGLEEKDIYIAFRKDGYEIKSKGNFIHTPVIHYGNLRYACITELGYELDEKEREKILDNLKMNAANKENVTIVQSN